jgi:hypothetical protein
VNGLDATAVIDRKYLGEIYFRFDRAPENSPVGGSPNTSSYDASNTEFISIINWELSLQNSSTAVVT